LTHPRGRQQTTGPWRDHVTARQNIVDTARGLKAQRSSYGHAPGGSVYLDVRMLKGMLALASHYNFRVTQIAGGSHSPNSRHYAGIPFDVDVIDNRPVTSSNPYIHAFMAEARRLGATEVFGPGDPGHATHIHVA
jgi:zinc D-Ala-D-Ala carboxypeptidase